MLFQVVESYATKPAVNKTTLYTHTLCPYAERAWLTLLEKQVKFDLIHIDLSNKPDWYGQVNPRGLVPAVEHKGELLVESVDICRGIDCKVEGPMLMPLGSLEQKEANHLIDTVDGFVSAGLDFMAGRSGRSWGIGRGQTFAQQSAFEEHLAVLQSYLETFGGPYLIGQQLTLADLVYYPFARRFEVGMKQFCDYDIDTALRGNVKPWLQAMRERPSCIVASANDQLLLQAYLKYKCLDFFDYTSISVFDLHPHNAIFSTTNA